MLKDYEKIRNLNYKKDFTLFNIQKILALLNHPEKDLQFIHIAGTKGKTSTAFYISELLQMSGYKNIGLYTSPHIISPTERIQINGKPIEENKLKDIFESIEKLALNKQIPLTYFEVLTVCAFLYFKENSCSIVVLETGLGGRLDATNTVMPILSVITKIDQDHTHILGKNKLKIAYEKFGIIKRKIPFILVQQSFFVSILGSFIGFIRKSKKIKPIKTFLKKAENSYTLISQDIEIIFEGPFYGIENFITALTCLKFLKPSLSGCFQFTHNVPGRFEIYKNEKGLIILDGAHNPLAAKQLVKSILELAPDNKWTFIFNSFPDKDYEKMILEFQKITKEFIVMEKENYATQPIFDFLKRKKIPCRIQKLEDLQLIKDQYYCVTGSFYLVGDFKNAKLTESYSQF